MELVDIDFNMFCGKKVCQWRAFSFYTEIWRALFLLSQKKIEKIEK